MERIDRYFEGAAWKYLSAVDAEPKRSNQHELGGLPSAGFMQYLGDPGNETLHFPARYIYLAEDESDSLSIEGNASWYDGRRGNPVRSPEYRLYYETNAVTESLREGLFLLIAKTTDGTILLTFAEPGSSAEQQLRWLFGLEGDGLRLAGADIGSLAERPSWAATWILGELGVETELPDDKWLDALLKSFGGGFPATKVFSSFARQAVDDVDPIDSPDDSLVCFIDMEERLFRLLERHFVADRIKKGFDDVDDFVNYSLSIQNRRKSRAGHALEHHLQYIFDKHQLRFDKGAVTENRAKPDFLFPGLSQYHDEKFPDSGLTMLGAKSTCKDRWRQVLSEAKRIRAKHLATLEPGISAFQLAEMRAHNLQLVVPEPLHVTYVDKERTRIWSLSRFIDLAKGRQSRYVT